MNNLNGLTGVRRILHKPDRKRPSNRLRDAEDQVPIITIREGYAWVADRLQHIATTAIPSPNAHKDTSSGELGGGCVRLPQGRIGFCYVGNTRSHASRCCRKLLAFESR